MAGGNPVPGPLEELQALLTDLEDPQVLLTSSAEALAQTVVDGIDSPTDNLVEVCHTLGWWHWLRYVALPDGQGGEDLERAIALLFPIFRENLGAVPDPLRNYYTQREGRTQQQDWRASGDGVDLQHALTSLDTAGLHEAVSVLEQRVTEVALEDVERPRHLSVLGNALVICFERTGNADDLNRAIEAFEQAVITSPSGDPERPGRLSNLGNVHAIFFERTGNADDLNRAIEALEQAVITSPSGDPERPGRLSNLGNLYAICFERTGNADDLSRAIDVLEQAVAAASTDDPNRPAYLSGLGNVLRTCFERTGNADDLSRAIDVLEQAVAAASTDDPNRPVYLSGLCNVLRTCFERTGNADDLSRAIDVLEQAVAATPREHLERPGRLSNFGNALATLYERSGDTDDLDRATVVFQEAVATSTTGHPDRSAMLCNLGNVLAVRHQRIGELRDMQRAFRAFRSGALEELAPTWMRAHSAREWGRCAGILDDWVEAVEGYGSAVQFVAQAVPGWLGRADQEHLLTQVEGIGPDAAAACLQAGWPERAVELFEQGRGVLLAQTLDARTDLTDLIDLHPDLAAKYENLSRQFLTPTADTSLGITESDAVVPDAQDRRRAHDQTVELLDQIRGLDGFATFLLPRPQQTCCQPRGRVR